VQCFEVLGKDKGIFWITRVSAHGLMEDLNRPFEKFSNCISENIIAGKTFEDNCFYQF